MLWVCIRVLNVGKQFSILAGAIGRRQLTWAILSLFIAHTSLKGNCKKNNVWYHVMSLDGISEFVLQLNNTTNINSNKRALVCFIFNYYLLF